MRDFKSLLARAVGFSSAFAAMPLVAAAQTAGNRGLEIAEEADRRDAGFVSQVATLTMTLRNRHGQESVRELRTRTLEVEGDGDKSLVVFAALRTITHVKILLLTEADRDRFEREMGS